MLRWVLVVAASIGAACAHDLTNTPASCPPGRTLLDGVCVREDVADYVACVRAQGAQLGADKSQRVSADATTLGVHAGGAAEVKESLEKRYAVSDAATLEIVRACGKQVGSESGGTACGGAGQACCSTSPSCGPSLGCDTGSKRCVASCGGEGQPCCSNGAACGASLGCDLQRNSCRAPCGGDGQPCCSASPSCGEGMGCARESNLCAASCGAAGQPCCSHGAACGAGLACGAENTCR